MIKDYNMNQVVMPMDLFHKLPVFGFLKANLHFTRMSVRGKEQVRNRICPNVGELEKVHRPTVSSTYFK
ncbi:hypothetical protein [Evansella halocellulosilytica]|uniref:hypothetical protein n=1 Tax=Evansella halocellulosilytica TaxID=2011013 RepID=UPI000BB822AF|nr:hypothetical protein [Evansella halocellulosilytica]